MGKDREGCPGKPGAVDAGRSGRGQDSTTRQYIWCYSEQGPARIRLAENAAGTPRIFAAAAESNRNDKCVLLTLPVCGQAAEKNGRSAASTAPRSEPVHSGANAPIRPLLNSAIIAAAIGVCAPRILRRKHCLRDSQDQSVSGYSMCDPTVRVYATNGMLGSRQMNAVFGSSVQLCIDEFREPRGRGSALRHAVSGQCGMTPGEAETTK